MTAGISAVAAAQSEQQKQDKQRKDVRLDALVDSFKTLQDCGHQKAEQFCEAFLKTIESGYWRPGDLIPTEKEIAAVLPVSLGTVQIALRRLATDGIIKRTRRSGSTISVPPDPRLDPKHICFVADDGKSLLPHKTEHISVTESTEQGAWSAYIGELESYIKIVRHIRVGQDFTLYAEFYLGGEKFRPLLDIAPETFKQLHLRLILHDRFHCPSLGFTQAMSFVAPLPSVAEIIGCPLGHAALIHEIFSYTLREKPLSYQKFIIPPNNRKLIISGSELNT